MVYSNVLNEREEVIFIINIILIKNINVSSAPIPYTQNHITYAL